MISQVTEIRFVNGATLQNQRDILRHMKPFMYLVPTWCHRIQIRVELSDEEHQSAIGTHVSYEYRRATMKYYSGWFTEPEKDKWMHVIHDMLHIHNSAYMDFVEDYFDVSTKDKDDKVLYNVLIEQSRLYNESAIQDLAMSILNMSIKRGLIKLKET